MTQLSEIHGEIDSQGKVRASVSLPREIHAELEQIARSKRVSLAWVIRDAAEQYLAEWRKASSAQR
ncbi:hypothetical protein KBK24_0120490 [Burkholderia sp. K24]|jgi:metal-responsive CopG/Arc/MetJ family transcriptional regulator|nr:hypothetical protein KBK24_0120490 [Burkholderia sp. K24]